MKYTYKMFDGRVKTKKKPLIFTAVIAFVAIVLIVAAVNSVKSSNRETTTTTTTAVSETSKATTASTTSQPQSETKKVVSPDGADLGTTVVTSATQTIPTSKTEVQTTKTPAVATTQDPQSYSKEQILKVVSDSVNKLKSAQNFTGEKNQNTVIQLTDCSVPALTSTINKVLERFAGDRISTYDFTNGKAIDPEDKVEVTPLGAIPPSDKQFSLTIDGVADAKVEKDGENTTYTVTAVAESTSLESPEPHYNAMAADYLDLSNFDLKVGKITKCDFDYPGNSVSVTLNKDGNIIKYRQYIPMSGTGEGKVGLITAGGTMEGYMDEIWTITWK